jgi:hypothetical protein
MKQLLPQSQQSSGALDLNTRLSLAASFDSILGVTEQLVGSAPFLTITAPHMYTYRSAAASTRPLHSTSPACTRQLGSCFSKQAFFSFSRGDLLCGAAGAPACLAAQPAAGRQSLHEAPRASWTQQALARAGTGAPE